MTNDTDITQDDDRSDFQQNPGETNPMHDMKRAEHLKSDEGQTPLSAPDDVPGNHEHAMNNPQTDTGMDEHESYDAGVIVASGGGKDQ